MRAREFINEKINPDILNTHFHHEVEIHGYRYVARTENNLYYDKVLRIKVFDGEERIAETYFHVDDDSLVVGLTVVWPEYRKQNIATNMYAYAKMLGNDITPSNNQLDAGQAMWKSWNQSGQSKHILPKGYQVRTYHDEYDDEY